ncbi:protein Dr1 [Cimex lectularius]|uniref:Protein Dr1 n=1 Tax=Cimex lectularius TaxID=79782 RepID=A0A8I6TI59_CIMLE|nr:protein Dr1 [Cimex lectularius]
MDINPEMSTSSGNVLEDEELTLPRASINKMIKEIVPSLRVAFESRELILNCCTEFIHLIASEANEICNQSKKKTINAKHVLLALDRLGFDDYRVVAEDVLKDCKEVAAKKRRQSTRLENLGIPEEELLRQQQELFAKAREEQAQAEQQQWLQLQEATKIVNMQKTADESDPDDYS